MEKIIDFKKYVDEYKDDFIKDLVSILKINSELTEFDPNSKTPFGKGIDDTLRLFLDIAKKDGFVTNYVDGYAGDIVFGDGDGWVGSIGHLDVVPAGLNWDFPPYGGVISDDKIYARGVEDDKGPTMCFYYAMKILKRLVEEGKITLSKRLKLILATDEESGMRDVEYYFKRYPEQPVYGFIPDADFPLIFAEKGIADLKIEAKFSSNNILSMKGGYRTNMVIEYATAKIRKMSKDIESQFLEYLDVNKLSGKVEGNEISVEGVSAHGATPELGKNAIFLLNDFLKTVFSDDDLVRFIDKYLAYDYFGQKLNINYIDKDMGKLTSNLGIFDFHNGKMSLILNIRYPKGIETVDIIERSFNSIKEDVEVSALRNTDYLFFDTESFLVKTLLSVYQKHTNDYTSKPVAIGGGTFAKALKNSVAFGPHFPNSPSFIHNKNEYLEIDEIMKALLIYVESLYLLAK